jgi:hypothetical protein
MDGTGCAVWRGLGSWDEGLVGVAIDDLPMPVVNFLNVIGIEWPYINEDTLHQFATLVRDFGQAVEQTHQDATQVVSKIAAAHQGASTKQMSSGWAELSSRHVTEIVDGASVLADALDAWAVYVVAQKFEAIGQLVDMAIEFFADQAASVFTLGLAEGALPLIILAGQKIGQSLIQDLEQYAVGMVMEAALKPFLAKFEAMISGLDWSQTSSTGTGVGSGFSIDEGEVRAQIAVMRAHSATMKSHGTTLKNGIAGLSF